MNWFVLSLAAALVITAETGGRGVCEPSQVHVGSSAGFLPPSGVFNALWAQGPAGLIVLGGGPLVAGHAGRLLWCCQAEGGMRLWTCRSAVAAPLLELPAGAVWRSDGCGSCCDVSTFPVTGIGLQGVRALRVPAQISTSGRSGMLVGSGAQSRASRPGAPRRSECPIDAGWSVCSTMKPSLRAPARAVPARFPAEWSCLVLSRVLGGLGRLLALCSRQGSLTLVIASAKRPCCARVVGDGHWASSVVSVPAGEP